LILSVISASGWNQPSNAELVARGDGNAVAEVDLDHLFAVDLAARLVDQRGEHFLVGDIDDFAGRRA